MEDARTLFEIPAENMPKFEAAIAKLSRKAVKLYGEESAIKPFIFSHEDKVLSDGHTHRVFSVLLNAEMPPLDGWMFVARLDHSNETGTIVRRVPNAPELPAQYREGTSNIVRCDHCQVKRFRRDTFVMKSLETGEFKQVGSTCLKDFFGHDVSKSASMAELLGYAAECGRGFEELADFRGADRRWVNVEEFCALAARSVRQHGWVSAATARDDYTVVSTREDTMVMYNSNQSPSDEDRALATEALEWAASLREKTDKNDYEHNIMVIAEAPFMEMRSAGLAASIVGVYHNKKVREQQGSRTVDVGDFTPVIELFKKAGKNLAHPKIRLQLPNGSPITLSVAGRLSKAPGTVNITDGTPYDPYNRGGWYGRVTPQGVWDRSRYINGETMTSLTALLSALATDPAGTAAKYGKLTGQCCFCRKPLNDARSTAVGYGKTCASNYELPWG